MKKILIIGAGLSSGSLISYLLHHSQKYHWKIRLADIDLALAESRIGDHPNGKAIYFNIKDLEQRTKEIEDTDVVISMLPASMHPVVAKECLRHKKHLLTPSYVSPEMQTMDEEAKENDLLFMNELGVDPGIDHMSAMKVIHKIKDQGGILKSFHSYTGGLVAPDCDNNPWNYKFSWNPRNIVVAGTGVAQYKEDNVHKYIPYHKLFSNILTTSVPEYGNFEVYPNRDSLKYIKTYDLEGIPSIMRGTIRRPGYCKAWDVFVQLGCTDDSYIMNKSEDLSYKDYIRSFIPNCNSDVKQGLSDYLDININSLEMKKLEWLEIFSDEKIKIKEATPAMVLQKILENKWSLEPHDKDLLIMQHIFEYELNGKEYITTSSMCIEGKDASDTAMSFTVGTPLAIAAKLLLTNQIDLRGVHIPILPEIYNPILEELENLNIKFHEHSCEL